MSAIVVFLEILHVLVTLVIAQFAAQASSMSVDMFAKLGGLATD